MIDSARSYQGGKFRTPDFVHDDGEIRARPTIVTTEADRGRSASGSLNWLHDESEKRYIAQRPYGPLLNVSVKHLEVLTSITRSSPSRCPSNNEGVDEYLSQGRVNERRHDTRGIVRPHRRQFRMEEYYSIGKLWNQVAMIALFRARDAILHARTFMKKAFRRCFFDRIATSISFIAALDSLSSDVPSSSTLAPQAIHLTPTSSYCLEHYPIESLFSFRVQVSCSYRKCHTASIDSNIQGSTNPVIDRKTPSSLYSRRPMDSQWVSDLDVPSNPAKNP